MGHIIPYVMVILLSGMIIWAHVSTIIYLIKEDRKDKLSSMHAITKVDGVTVIVQAKYCPQCSGTLRQDDFLFGMHTYQCSNGHRFVGRGRGRMTPVSDLQNAMIFRN